MDPSQNNWQSLMQMMQNCQGLSQNDQFQVPQFSTQAGLENIILDDNDEVADKATGKKRRDVWSKGEDELFIQSWLNVSKDAEVGMDQKAEAFWTRVLDAYNEYRGPFVERQWNQIKCRWQKLNATVQKFVECYKQAMNLKQSGTTEEDVINMACNIFKSDEGKIFRMDHAWRLLKNEPKCTNKDESTQNAPKRTKNDASSAYSSSDTPTSDYNPTLPTITRPMGKKASKSKGKGKGKVGATSSHNFEDNLEYKSREYYMKKFARMKEKAIQHKQEKLKQKDVATLFVDTSAMNESQCATHEAYCAQIKDKYGLP